MIMTINDLRKEFPHYCFYFFKNGWELDKAPFLHTIIKSYEVKTNCVFIEI